MRYAPHRSLTVETLLICGLPFCDPNEELSVRRNGLSGRS